MSTTQDLSSIGHAAGLLKRHPSTIRTAADQLGIAPAMLINGVPYYTTRDIERIADHLRHQEPSK